MGRMLEVLAEFDRRRVWDRWGCASPQQWLGWKRALGYTAASERLRVARALRRRTPKDVIAQIDSSGLAWESDDTDGSIVITLRLPTDAGQAVIAAINAATQIEHGVPARRSRADACARLITGSDEARARPEVIVHLHADSAAYDDGTAVAPEIVECISCDGPVTTIADTVHGPVIIKKDPPPSRAQRRWLRLRHRTCQFPGCHHDSSFDAHHIIPRHLGGKTHLANMVRLCQFHHRLVHTLDLRLTLHADRTLEARFPAGNPVDRTIEHAPFTAPAPADPNLITGNWTGEGLNHNWLHLTVQSRQQPTPKNQQNAAA